jgi:hypothetical protein
MNLSRQKHLLLRVKEADPAEPPIEPHAKIIIILLSQHLRLEELVKGQESAGDCSSTR